MSQPTPSDDTKTRLKEQLKGYPKLPKQQALLFPLKNEIRELRARNAAYDDIRLILEQENIVVSLNTLYRFCGDVLGEKKDVTVKSRLPKAASVTAQPASVVQPDSQPAGSIQTALQEHKHRQDRIPGLWSRRKRGPRIANSKTL
jgi:hypothetical protein